MHALMHCLLHALLRAMSVLLPVLFAGLVPATAHADAGEVTLDLALMPEVAFLAPPVAPRAEVLPFGRGSAVTFLPRLGASARYDLFNAFGVGAGIDGGAFPNVTATSTTVGAHTGELHVGAHVELCAPLIASYRFDSGYDLTGRLELHIGPALFGYLGNALSDPSRPDASGLPSALPVAISDVWRLGAAARLVALFEARMFDLFVIDVGPYAGVSFAETAGFHVGLLVRPSLTFGGPT